MAQSCTCSEWYRTRHNALFPSHQIYNKWISIMWTFVSVSLSHSLVWEHLKSRHPSSRPGACDVDQAHCEWVREENLYKSTLQIRIALLFPRYIDTKWVLVWVSVGEYSAARRGRWKRLCVDMREKEHVSTVHTRNNYCWGLERASEAAVCIT